MLDAYELTISVKCGFIVKRFIIPAPNMEIGWCLCSIFSKPSDNRLDELVKALPQIAAGTRTYYEFGGSEMDVRVTTEKVEITIPYQNEIDLAKPSVFEFPFSLFNEAVHIWHTFLQHTAYYS